MSHPCRRQNAPCINGEAACAASPGLIGAVIRSSEVVVYSTGAADSAAVARYRNVTTWPLVQVASGPKVVSVMPFVTSFSTAQATALP